MLCVINQHRYDNHKQSFNNEVYSSQTELSKCVWQLKKAKVKLWLHLKIYRFENKEQCFQCDVVG